MKVSDILANRIHRLNDRFTVARASGDSVTCERIKRRSMRMSGLYLRVREFEYSQPV